MEGYGPDGFKTAVVTPLIMKLSLPVDDLKNYHLYLALVSCQTG